MNRRNWILAGLAGAAVWTGVGARAYADPTPTATRTVAVKAVAVVNGEAVTRAEFDAAVKQAGLSAAVPENQRLAQQREVLDILIDNLLLQQYLAKNAPPVTVADVNARVAEFEAQLKKTNKTFPEYLKDTNQTEGEFRGDLVQSMRWDGLARAKITDAYLQQYYTANKDFFDHVAVRVSHIELLTAPNATEADKAKARQQLTDLRADLLAGKVEFAEAAKKVSQSSTAANGGDLGFIAQVHGGRVLRPRRLQYAGQRRQRRGADRFRFAPHQGDGAQGRRAVGLHQDQGGRAKVLRRGDADAPRRRTPQNC